MKQFFKFMFASMLGTFIMLLISVFLFFGTIAVVISSFESDKEETITSNGILHLDLSNPIPDRNSGNPFENFNFDRMEANKNFGLNEILKNIEKAKNDPNIDGIFLNTSYMNAGFATIEEIRDALIDFKTSGKYIVSYAESYSQGAYYIASVADEIHLNPTGFFELKGLNAQLMFFKGAMEKLEIEPQVFRHGKFKSAIEPFLLDKMSDDNRKQSKQFMGSIWDHVVKEISAARNMSSEGINQLADNLAVTNANSALENKFIDKISYQDEVIDLLKAKNEGDEELNLIKLNKYNKVKSSISKDLSASFDNRIAVIYASGEIMSGKSTNDAMGSETIAKAIKKARLDEKVKTIVLRINSPGGSALASDVMWREVKLAKEVKPVVVSMGNLAASGGYYMACAATKIVASENTITGSIGVFGLIPNMQKMFNNKLGITFDTVKTNKYSDINTVFRPLTSYEKAIVQNQVEDIYDQFLGHVAEGRSMSKEEVDEIGQGRVWSGSDALKIGLVDEIGGLNKAIEIAANLAEMGENYKIIELPERSAPFEMMVKNLSEEAKASVLNATFGENLKVYNQMENYIHKSGIFARMPFDYIFN